MRCASTIAAGLVLALGSSWAVGQAAGLKLERQLAPLPRGEQAPIFVSGERIEAQGQAEIEVTGAAELRKQGLSIRADRLHYLADTDEVEATGSVRLVNDGDRVTGPRLRLRVEDAIGIFNEPSFQLAPRANRLRGGGEPVETRGDARAMRFEGEGRYRLAEASFTSCKPEVDDWYLRARELDLDFGDDIGTARGARLSFLGVTTPALPWVDFSLSNARKSGFLPPTFGIQGKVGTEIVVPFYWNIAPNRDATIAPRFMARRGLQLQTEVRYLEPGTAGTLRHEYLPADQVLGTRRYATAWLHTMTFPWVRGLSAMANVNKVSDDAYFRDLSGRVAIATQTYLPREGAVTYAPSPWWNTAVRVQRFQTLQDVNNPLTPPYERVPQIQLNANRQEVLGLDLNLASEYTAFDHPTLVTGRRLVAYPSVTYPLINPGFTLTPKAGVHLSTYNLDETGSTPARRPDRAVPIFSLDSGLVFERPLQYRDLDLVQTLEPRVYYVYIPFREQSDIPLFDSGIADLNYAQIFSENFYSGSDRISDANQLTLALTSRLIRSDSGQETLRGFVAQRQHFADQRVALAPGIPLRTQDRSSILFGLSGQVWPRVTAELAAQVGSAAFQTERMNASVRYQPALNKIFNLSYRYTTAALNPSPQPLTDKTDRTIRQVDVSGQWPVGRGFSIVARYNYSLVNRATTESVFGIEYNAGCWILRTVAQRFVTATGELSRSFFLQLELDGFSRIGSNPLEALRRNIPGYAVGRSQPGSIRPLNLYE